MCFFTEHQVKEQKDVKWKVTGKKKMAKIQFQHMDNRYCRKPKQSNKVKVTMKLNTYSISEKAGKNNIKEPTPRYNLFYHCCLFCLLNSRMKDYQEDSGRKLQLPIKEEKSSGFPMVHASSKMNNVYVNSVSKGGKQWVTWEYYTQPNREGSWR